MNGKLAELRSALADRRRPSVEWAQSAWDLAVALDEAFIATDDVALLSEAITLQRELAATLRPGRFRTKVLTSLGVDLSTRYHNTAVGSDLDEAIELARELLAEGDEASWVTARVNLGGRLLAAWDDRADETALHEAIEVLSAAVADSNVDDEGRAALAPNLANAHRHRHDLHRDPDDLLAAVRWFRLALDRPHDEHDVPGLQGALAITLVDTHKLLGEPGALDEATRLADEAVAAPGPARARAVRWDTRALVYLARFERDGRLEDLGAAVASGDKAVAALPEGAVGRAGMMATAAALRFELFIQTNDRDALDASIDRCRAGLAEPGGVGPHDRAALANQLCMALTERCVRYGDSRDLDEALAAVDEALVPGLRLDMELGLRTNRALALHERFKLLELRPDLDAAIDEIEAVVTKTPASTERPIRLNSAGLLHAQRAEADRSRADLERAIGAGREAVAGASSGHDRALYLTNLAAWLDTRFEWLGDRADLDEAIASLETALRQVGTESSHRAAIAFTLGGRYALRHDRFAEGGDVADLQQACDYWDEALGEEEPFVTVLAGQRLGNVAFQEEMWAESEQALALSLEAARALTGRRVRRADRERARFEVQGTAAAAALAAVRAGRPPDAVLHLEGGAATLLAATMDEAAPQPALADVVAAAQILGGPLVYWAATPAGSVALVVGTNGTVRSTSLEATTGDAEAAIARLSAAFDRDHMDPLTAWTAAADELLAWTWQALVEPVRPLVGDPPAVGVIPVGRLAALPLGVAGGGRSLAETAAVHTLTYARSVSEPAAWPDRPVPFVAADPGPQERFLQNAQAEADAVAALYAGADSLSPARPGQPKRRLRRNGQPSARHVPGSPSHVPKLIGAVAGADVAHLACHFDFDPEEPLTSVLLLGGPQRLADLVASRLPAPVHLVLSACDSGLTGVRLPDEAIGPAPLFVAAGARSVTAALWPVDDEEVPRFMVEVHRRMSHGVAPADALAAAQRAARDDVPSCVWAAFTHTGP